MNITSQILLKLTVTLDSETNDLSKPVFATVADLLYMAHIYYFILTLCLLLSIFMIMMYMTNNLFNLTTSEYDQINILEQT